MVPGILARSVLSATVALVVLAPCARAEQGPVLSVRTNKHRFLAYEPVLVEATVANGTPRPISVFGWIPQKWDYQMKLYAALVPKPPPGEPQQPPLGERYLHVRAAEHERIEPAYVELLPGQRLSTVKALFWDYNRQFGRAYSLKGMSVPVPPEVFVTFQAGILWLKIVYDYDFRGGVTKKVIFRDISVEIQEVPEAEKEALRLWKDIEVAKFLETGGLDESTRKKMVERLEQLRSLAPQTPEEAKRRDHEMNVCRQLLNGDEQVRGRLRRLAERHPQSVYSVYARAVLSRGAQWPEALVGRGDAFDEAKPGRQGSVLADGWHGQTEGMAVGEPCSHALHYRSGTCHPAR